MRRLPVIERHDFRVLEALVELFQRVAHVWWYLVVVVIVVVIVRVLGLLCRLGAGHQGVEMAGHRLVGQLDLFHSVRVEYLAGAIVVLFKKPSFLFKRLVDESTEEHPVKIECQNSLSDQLDHTGEYENDKNGDHVEEQGRFDGFEAFELLWWTLVGTLNGIGLVGSAAKRTGEVAALEGVVQVGKQKF